MTTGLEVVIKTYANPSGAPCTFCTEVATKLAKLDGTLVPFCGDICQPDAVARARGKMVLKVAFRAPDEDCNVELCPVCRTNSVTQMACCEMQHVPCCSEPSCMAQAKTRAQDAHTRRPKERVLDFMATMR